MKHFILTLSSILFLTSCSSTVATNITNQKIALTKNDKVAFLDVGDAVPENAVKIGNTKFGDSGFSTDCSFDSNLIKARQIARGNGANIIKVTENKKPGIWSTCNRMKIDFYNYNGDVTSLQQYQLQIK